MTAAEIERARAISYRIRAERAEAALHRFVTAVDLLTGGSGFAAPETILERLRNK